MPDTDMPDGAVVALALDVAEMSQWIAARLQDRVTDLEAENAKLREALRHSATDPEVGANA